MPLSVCTDEEKDLPRTILVLCVVKILSLEGWASHEYKS